MCIAHLVVVLHYMALWGWEPSAEPLTFDLYLRNIHIHTQLLVKRVTLLAEDECVTKVLPRVFPPDAEL